MKKAPQSLIFQRFAGSWVCHIFCHITGILIHQGAGGAEGGFAELDIAFFRDGGGGMSK